MADDCFFFKQLVMQRETHEFDCQKMLALI